MGREKDMNGVWVVREGDREVLRKGILVIERIIDALDPILVRVVKGLGEGVEVGVGVLRGEMR